MLHRIIKSNYYKYLLLIIVLDITTNVINAQNAHISFMDIPICGDAYYFKQKLEKKNFKFVRQNFDTQTYQFTGNFAGRKAAIALFYSRIKGIAYQVMVSYDARNFSNFDSIKRDVFELYKSKYGNPKICESQYGKECYRWNVYSNGDNVGKIEMIKGTSNYIDIIYIDKDGYNLNHEETRKVNEHLRNLQRRDI